MTLIDKRNRSRIPYIEPDLLEQGITQLSMEIRILKGWLKNIDPSEVEARRSYEDMLRSRHEMLQSLTQQKISLQEQPAS